VDSRHRKGGRRDTQLRERSICLLEQIACTCIHRFVSKIGKLAGWLTHLRKRASDKKNFHDTNAWTRTQHQHCFVLSRRVTSTKFFPSDQDILGQVLRRAPWPVIRTVYTKIRWISIRRKDQAEGQHFANPRRPPHNMLLHRLHSTIGLSGDIFSINYYSLLYSAKYFFGSCYYSHAVFAP
jgi:hypothetical protein